MSTTSVQTSKDLLERIRTRLIKLGEIDDFGPELFQLLNVKQPELPEIAQLKREVSQLRQHKNDYMEAATQTAGALERQIVELKTLIVDINADPGVLNLNDALTERMDAALRGSRHTALAATTKEHPVMNHKPIATEEQPNTWTRGGQGKSSDSGAVGKFLASQMPKPNQPK